MRIAKSGIPITGEMIVERCRVVAAQALAPACAVHGSGRRATLVPRQRGIGCSARHRRGGLSFGGAVRLEDLAVGDHAEKKRRQQHSGGKGKHSDGIHGHILG